MRRLVVIAAAAVGVAVSTAALVATVAYAAPPVSQLHGTLVLAPGQCSGGSPSGSYLSATFGTRAIRNPRSSCDHGSVTLLPRGRGGLSTQVFSPATDNAFDRDGNAIANSISKPVAFGSHRLALVSSARNLQDAARGPALFSLPKIYVAGTKAYADLRSLQVLYGGLAGTTCAGASGYGCWLIGTERATGTYNPATHRLTLTWFTGQSFVGASAGTAVHLAGIFHGSPRALSAGSTVELGTSSFAAGRSQPVAARSTATTPRETHHPMSRSDRLEHAVADDSESTSTGSPRTFLIGELVVAVNVFAFVLTTSRRRR